MVIQMALLTKQEFNTKLAAVVRSFNTQRETVQALLVDGFEMYKDTDDCGRLANVVNKLHGTGVVATVKLCDYICAYANVQVGKTKAGDFKFSRVSGATETVVKEIDVTWYAYNKAAQDKAFDAGNLLEQFKKKLNAALAKEETDEDERAKAQAILSALEEF
mgnify:CR=1 FL=1